MSAYDHIGYHDKFYVNDYIYSPSRLYFAVLEANGEFNIYAGESPDDSAKIKVWSSNRRVSPPFEHLELYLSYFPALDNKNMLYVLMNRPGNHYFEVVWRSGGSGDLKSPIEARLGDDGKLSLRQNQNGVWNEKWNNGFSDPVVEYIVETLDYDKPRAKIKSNADVGILEQILQNDTSVDQTMKMSRKHTTAIVSSWSNATGLKTTVGGKVTVGVPGVSSGEASWSLEFSNTYTFGESTSNSFEIGFDFNLTVPANKTYRGWAQITQAELEVPYTVFGELHFKSGRRIKHKLSGTYTGKNGDLGRYHIEDITGGKSIPLMFRMEGLAKSTAQIYEVHEIP
jgi:hypothetical protein